MAQKRAKRRSITWWETELQRFATEGTVAPKTTTAVMQAVERLAILEASNDTLKNMNDQLTAARQIAPLPPDADQGPLSNLRELLHTGKSPVAVQRGEPAIGAFTPSDFDETVRAIGSLEPPAESAQ